MSSRKNQKAYWNKVADSKEFLTPFNSTEFSALVPKSARILDVGCGYGRILAELQEYGYSNLSGLDFSTEMIAKGKRLNPSFNLKVQEQAALDLSDNSVDAVILFAVLTSIISDDEQKFLIAEIARVLKPGGIVYINDFTINNDERNITRYNQYADKYGEYGFFEMPDGGVMRHHRMEYIAKLLSGFEKLIFEPTVFTTMNGNPSNGFYYFGKKR